jgi:hypothetical protein
MGFLEVRLKDYTISIFILQAILIKIAHVSKSLQMSCATCLFPHLKILIWLAVQSSLVQRP